MHVLVPPRKKRIIKTTYGFNLAVSTNANRVQQTTASTLVQTTIHFFVLNSLDKGGISIDDTID
jgi:hypothetical protein